MTDARARDEASARDAAMMTLFLGFFASAWFSWAQAAPPDPWRAPLDIAAFAALAVAVVGGVQAWRHRSDGSVLAAPGAMRAYNIIVAVEFASCALGALALGWSGHAQYIPVWVALVVGAHFWPLAPLLANRLLVPLGAVLVVAAAAGLAAGVSDTMTPSAPTGAVAGASLLVGAAAPLRTAVGAHRSRVRTTRS
ncbi:MAG: hypothetical protein ACRDO8_03975 [Nocardioidaceae bacterium]